MMGYYNRDGTKIESDSAYAIFAKLYEDDDARRVASTHVELFWVSTVFLGLDHSYDDGPPLIFETMVFDQDPDNEESDLLCERYSTEAEALAGHEAVVKSLIDGTFRDYSGEVIDSTFVIMEEPTLI